MEAAALALVTRDESRYLLGWRRDDGCWCRGEEGSSRGERPGSSRATTKEDGLVARRIDEEGGTMQGRGEAGERVEVGPRRLGGHAGMEQRGRESVREEMRGVSLGKDS